MSPSTLLTGNLLAATDALPIRLRVIFGDLRSRFLAKGRVGKGYRFIARNGRVLLATDAPLADLVDAVVEARLQVWHRAILPGDIPQPYGLLLCVRSRGGAQSGPVQRGELVAELSQGYELAIAVGGGRWLEFHARS
jgi:hypothetical protein